MSEEVEEIKLTGKQKLFADYYIGEANLNAAKAAIRAGYSEKSAKEIGYENLTKLHIWTYIEKRLDEISLKQKEVTANFTTIAKGTIADVLDRNGKFDYEVMVERGADKLVKKLKIKKTVRVDPATKEIVEETSHEIELYDALAANTHVAKLLGMFVDRTDVTSNGKEIKTVTFQIAGMGINKDSGE